MTDDDERITEILEEVNKLYYLIVNDHKKGKYLGQMYHNHLETIMMMVGKVRSRNVTAKSY